MDQNTATAIVVIILSPIGVAMVLAFGYALYDIWRS